MRSVNLLHNDLLGCNYCDTSSPHNAMHSSSSHYCNEAIYVLYSLQWGNSILHAACGGGHVQVVAIILSSGMSVDVRNDVSWYTVYM